MNKDIQLQAEKLNIKHRRKQLWYKILSVPVCIVVFITTYAMILPAITLETTPDTYCGMEEHIHSDECYEKPGVPEHKAIKCTAEEKLGEGEYLIHKHDTFCFNDSGELICNLAEQEEHTHTDECYTDGKLVCTKTKGIAHQHTDECIVTVPATEPENLICQKTVHKHTAQCFEKPVSTSAESSAELTGTETRPTYADYVATSDAITQKKTWTGTSTTINMTATSDKSTSQIESELTGLDTEDGKIITDKSVVYGKDDYGVFDSSSYSDTTFSVTLSALGQQYEDVIQKKYHTPLDVVFVLDTSGSMVCTPKTVTSGNRTSYTYDTYSDRAESAITTLNELARYVMELNGDNRFGIATFSAYHASYNTFDSRELLPIGSYSNAKTNDILSFTKLYSESGASGTNLAGNYFYSSVSVNTAVSGTSENKTYFYGGTYTTAGYYQANQMLQNSNGTYVDRDGVTVQRTPIVIFITDGCTTFHSNGSNKYEYNSSFTGGGSTMTQDDAFYGILSGYHYKQQIINRYSKGKFYTIGVGQEALTADMQATLNPNAETVNAMSSTYSTVKSNLLNGNNFPTNYRSMYGTEYSFCDGTYTSENFDPALVDKLKQYIAENAGEFIYRQSQDNRNDVQFVDIIGSGMEIKSDLVLRYAGQNYTMTLDQKSGVYRYSGNDTVKPNALSEQEYKLSEITARVETNADGNQQVTWMIPAALLPEYTHSRSSNWYYEMLPVRLLYQVGLTAEEETKVKSMANGAAPLTYYTNAYDTETDNAIATITPAEDQSNAVENSYYTDFTGEIKYKTEEANATTTRATYRDASAVDENKQVTIVLGNNGKLVFATNQVDTSSEKTAFRVQKLWKDQSGNTLTDTSLLPDYITAIIMANGVPYTSCALNAANGWEYTFDDLPTKMDDGSTITWSADEESVPAGFDKTGLSHIGASWVDASSIEDGTTYVIYANGSYAYNASGSNSAISTTISDNTKWVAVKQSDGTFRLRNVATGNYLGMYRTRGWQGYTYYLNVGAGTESDVYYNWTITKGTNNTYTIYQANLRRYLQLTSSGLWIQSYSSSLYFRTYEPSTYVITNTENPYVDLTVQKIVNASNTDGTFDIEVTYVTPAGETVTKTLSLENNGTGTVENIPVNSQVTVKELSHDGYTVTIKRKNNKLLASGDTYTFKITNDTNIVVHNTTSVILPETGSVGIMFFIYGGMSAMLIAVMAGLILRRRVRKEGD